MGTLITLVHNVLYKYSHQRLEAFCNVPQFAYLFAYFYENSGPEDLDGDKV